MAETPTGGLWQDGRRQKQPKDTYWFGKNGIQFNNNGSVENEPGFNFDSPAQLPAQPIGVIEVDNAKAVVFSTDNETSYIGYYDRKTNTYISIFDDSGLAVNDKLGFNTTRYITGEFQRNHKNQVIVAWTDKSVLRLINCDDPSVTTSKDLLFFLQANVPSLNVTVDSGGVLDKGAYFVAVRYLMNDGADTGYVTISNANIVSSPNPGSITDKALLITLDNLDQNYDKVQVAVISRINGEYKAFEMDAIEVGPDPVTLVYSGENITTPISLEEVLIPRPVYTRVGTLGQLNDSLYMADLAKEPELDLQKYVNLIKIRVKSELIDAVPPPQEHVTGKKPSLMHQEVYAIFARFHKISGGYTKAFLIPGNAPISTDDDAASGVHETDLGALNYQVTDTTRNADIANKTVDSGIWLNQNEVFPTTDSFNSSDIGGEDLRGLPVRHHRMPSLHWCKTNFYAGEPAYGKTKLDILGIQITNLNLPADIAAQLDGYEILIAKRTVANSTVIGQSLLLVAAQALASEGTELNFTSTGGNYNSFIGPFGNPGRALNLTGRENPYNGFGEMNPSPTAKPEIKFRFHAFDMLFNRPAVTPSYVSPQLKMRIDNVNQLHPVGGYIEAGDQNNFRVPIIIIFDYTKGITPVAVASNQRTRVVEDTRYLANNAVTGKWDNRDQETAFVGEFKWIGSTSDTANNDLPLSVPRSRVNIDGDQPIQDRVAWEETYLMNLMDLKDNVYVSFYSQGLIASGQVHPLANMGITIYPGDTFISDYSFHTYGWLNGINASGDHVTDSTRFTGYKTVHRFICESVSNINLRYEVEGNIYSQWWPNSPLAAETDNTSGYLYNFVRSIDPNQFGYSKDLNAQNDLGNLTAFNPYFEDITEFPYRIHRGGKLPRQGKARSWRNLLPLDYYEAQKNMGKINKVIGKDDRLLIHHENALFVTQDKLQLESDLLSVTLGTGDIFKFEPQEALSAKQGYAGNQHELASIDTPLGYVFVDAKQGQVFIYKNGLKMVNNGLNQFLGQQLALLNNNNTFTGNGITLGYDPEFHRLLITIKNVQLVANLDDFIPDYEPTQAFIDQLIQDVSIVYRHGKYLIYRGEYTSETFECDTCANPVGHPVNESINENTPNDTLVAQVDIDVLTPATAGNLYVAHFITAGNTGNAFRINSDGDIFVNNEAALDFETTPTFVLTILHITACGRTGTSTITIDINDVDEPPEVVDQELTIYESTPDTTIIAEIGGTDPEGLTLGYTLLTTGVPFAVDPITGELSIDGILDANLIDTYELQIEVSDGTMTAIATIVIHASETMLFFEPYEYICSGTTKQWTSIRIHEEDVTGAVLATVPNTAGQFYNSFPIPVQADEPASGDCTVPVGDNVQIFNVDSDFEISAIDVNFTIDTGTLPLAAGSNLLADHPGFTGTISTTVTGTGTASGLRLYINNIFQGILTVTAAGTYTFPSATYVSGDFIKLILKD